MFSHAMKKSLFAVATVLAVRGVLPGQAGGSTVLGPTEMQKLFPPSVYYYGQSAPTQLRNSGGVKFEDGRYVLTSLVDTSGYSSGVAAKYQGYFITEVSLKIEGKTLEAGAYGIGFIEGDKFIVTDLGGKEIFTVSTATDGAMKRPRPLQVTADPAGGFRVYAGRRYVRFDR